jgi:flagellar basal-body rod modification protein FlgD
MAIPILPPATPSIASAVASATTPGSSTASSVGVDEKTIAGNFTTFLQLLTTQLKNQNPLDPLDTNQFTAQLVQFAQVEQQLKQNDQLATLVSLQQTAQNTQALAFVGEKVGIKGATTALTNGRATWNLNVPKDATGTVTISSATGQQVLTGNYSMSAGTQPFTWDGKDSSGLQWPDGNYTISITAQDANGQPVSVPTEIEGLVDSVDLTQSPPTLSVNGQNYTLNQITRAVRSN